MSGKFFILAALVALGFACGRGPAHVRSIDGASREVRDDLGRTVVVPERIDRAISLAPSVTEMVFAAGAGDRLVGVTTYCNYPAEAERIEKIGDTQTPNVEKIIALRPQVVLVSTASQLEAFSKTLAEQGIAVYVIDPKTLDEVFANLRDLGQLFGTSESADKMSVTLAGRASHIRDQASNNGSADLPTGGEKPRVFVQISNEPFFTVGKDSFVTELIAHAGGISVTKDVSTAYPMLSKETAATLDPDVIILSDSEDNREPNVALQYSKAAKNGRVYRINADIISRPGPRLVDALEEIAVILAKKGR